MCVAFETFLFLLYNSIVHQLKIGCTVVRFCNILLTQVSFCSLGAASKAFMVKSKLPNSVLGKIWRLADLDKDGMLDADEFALANYLINLKLEGHEMPSEVPSHLIPPSKRGFQSDDGSLYPSVS